MQDTEPQHARYNGTVALGVTGSIAVYKAADLTSLLIKRGVEVHVLMTDSATELVQPRTFLTLSRNRVITDLWSVPDWEPEHIALAEKTDVLAIAPATANILAKLAQGIADDALSTFALSHTGPVIVAPAMNPGMWAHPAVQHNVDTLRERGVHIVGPGEGRTACDTEGRGRLEDVGTILEAIQDALDHTHAVSDSGTNRKKFLITAGPTCEDVDPVRFLSNRSSGKMGYALARAAYRQGHEVHLISGPAHLPAPAGCECTRVRSAAEMNNAVLEDLDDADVVIMAAAVADYRPSRQAGEKMHKQEGPLTLELERTEDILANVAAKKHPGQRIAGFAAETSDVANAAQRKCREKNLDMVVANDVSRRDAGFESDYNKVTVCTRDGQCIDLPYEPKADIAEDIISRLAEAQ